MSLCETWKFFFLPYDSQKLLLFCSHCDAVVYILRIPVVLGVSWHELFQCDGLRAFPALPSSSSFGLFWPFCYTVCNKHTIHLYKGPAICFLKFSDMVKIANLCEIFQSGYYRTSYTEIEIGYETKILMKQVFLFQSV